ncbi:MAG: acetolactate synthase 3 large subunit [Cellvibrionales bacterium]|nr:acetolactate synthase 3 large subunit [Cellvibrionales bacterium]
MLSGGDILVRSLQDAGVDILFGYPGGAALHIYDAIFRQQAIRHILVRHEQAATHAADGYARATGRVGTVLVTSGPGATNAITGIATAYMDSIPMVVISGQVMSHLIGADAFQETDMLGISRPVVKHSFMVKRPEDIPAIIARSFYIARTGRPGPVVVDIPKDTTHPHLKVPYTYPEAVQIRSYQPTVRGHAGQIKKAMAAILQAKRPVLYIGGGTVLGNASEPARRLAELLNFPVTNTLMGLGAIAGDDPRNLGMLGMHGTYEANMAMHHADLIISLGARFDDRTTNATEKYCPDATIVHVDIDPASISKTVNAHVPIVGPLDRVVEEMIRLLESSDQRPDPAALEQWWQQCHSWRAQHGLFVRPNHEPSQGSLIKPQDVIKTLYRVTEGDAIITSDVGQHQMFAAQYYHFNRPRQWLNSGGLGTMGYGLPAAMGAQFAYPEATVACVTGEGSIQMCIQELSTCTQYHLPVKIVNLNNQALGMVRQWQDMQYEGRYSESLYEESLPDFVKLAESYGHVGVKITRFEEMEGQMREAFALRDRLVFIDVQVDPAEHVYPMQIATGSMRDMWINKTERT